MRYRVAAALAVLLLGLVAGRAASSQTAGPAGGAGVVVERTAITSRTLSVVALAALPQVTRVVRLRSGHGDDTARWSGPLLWDVLTASGMVDPAKLPGQVRRVVRVTGADGYAAVLALAEISPDFAARPVLLALRREDQPLPDGEIRLIVPDERRAGRSVRGVVRIAIE